MSAYELKMNRMVQQVGQAIRLRSASKSGKQTLSCCYYCYYYLLAIAMLLLTCFQDIQQRNVLLGIKGKIPSKLGIHKKVQIAVSQQ